MFLESIINTKRIPLRSVGALKNQAAKLLREARIIDRRRYIKSLKVKVQIPDFDGQLVDLDLKTITIVNDNVEAVIPYDDVTSIVRKGEQYDPEYLTQLREKIKGYQVSKGFYLTTKLDTKSQNPPPLNAKHSSSSIDESPASEERSSSSIDDRESPVPTSPVCTAEDREAEVSQARSSAHSSRPDDGSKELIEIVKVQVKTIESLTNAVYALSQNQSRPSSPPGVAIGTMMSRYFEKYRNQKPGHTNCSHASNTNDAEIPHACSHEMCNNSRPAPQSKWCVQSQTSTLMSVAPDADVLPLKRPSSILPLLPPEVRETASPAFEQSPVVEISSVRRSSLAHENKLMLSSEETASKTHARRTSLSQDTSVPEEKGLKSKPRKSRHTYNQLRERVIQAIQSAYEKYDIDPDATFDYYESLGVIPGTNKAPLEHERLVDSILARLRKPPT